MPYNFIKFKKFHFKRNKSIQIKGATGSDYIKKNKLKASFFSPSVNFERDIVRNFIYKISEEKIDYIENLSINKKTFQRPRRLDYSISCNNKLYLIDVINNNKNKMKVLRKIYDQTNELNDIYRVILLVNNNIKDLIIKEDNNLFYIVNYSYEQHS
jgi:hypothetical protein